MLSLDPLRRVAAARVLAGSAALVLIVAACSGDSSSSSTSAASTTTGPAPSTSVTTHETTLAETTSTAAPTTTAIPTTTAAPTTTAGPASTALGTIPDAPTTTNGGFAPPPYTPEEVDDLRASCIYQGDQSACDTLVGELHLRADDAYGLGNSLVQAPDDGLAGQCVEDAYHLACLELESRHVPAEGDEELATSFADAVITGDADTLAQLAAPYLLELVPELAGPYPDADPAEVFYDETTGEFQFSYVPTLTTSCQIGGGVVTYCVIEGD